MTAGVNWSDGGGRLNDGGELVFTATAKMDRGYNVLYGAPFRVLLPEIKVAERPIYADEYGRRVHFDLCEGVYISDGGFTDNQTDSKRPFLIDRLKAGGVRERLTSSLPTDAPKFWASAVTVDGQGRVIAASDRAVYRLEGGKATRLAGGGTAALTSPAGATDIALSAPTAVVPMPDGGFLVVDD
jgi:hypothetical protein